MVALPLFKLKETFCPVAPVTVNSTYGDASLTVEPEIVRARLSGLTVIST